MTLSTEIVNKIIIIFLAARVPLAFILDAIFADPAIIPHPVVLMGKGISRLEKILRKIMPKNHAGEFTGGLILSLVMIFLSFFIPAGILILFVAGAITLQSEILLFLAMLLDIFWGFQALAARTLAKEAINTKKALESSIIEGRKAVSRIVGRDTKFLDEKGVIKACVETVAENLTDGVVSPLFYYAIGFSPLALAFKAVNTMDSMIAYRNERYFYFGKAAARLDDFFNFIPARFSAVLIIISAWILGFFKSGDYSAKNAVKIFLRDRKKHASPNAGQTESACAGALQVRLAGDAYYEGKIERKDFLGDDIRQIESEDILRAVKLMYLSSILAAVIAEVLAVNIFKLNFN